jgi:transcription antitermination factor NusG
VTLAYITPTAVNQRSDVEALGLSTSPMEPHWYAVYTSANHEKKVAAELGRRGVEGFLPLYSSVRRWKDRRVQLELPLFPGYVFVHVALQNRLRVVQVPGVAKIVGFGGLPAALPGEEIEALRAGLNGKLRAEPHPFLTAGRRVRVRSGPLAGMQGILLRRGGKARFVVSVELIMRSMSVEMDEADLEAV